MFLIRNSNASKGLHREGITQVSHFPTKSLTGFPLTYTSAFVLVPTCAHTHKHLLSHTHAHTWQPCSSFVSFAASKSWLADRTGTALSFDACLACLGQKDLVSHNAKKTSSVEVAEFTNTVHHTSYSFS